MKNTPHHPRMNRPEPSFFGHIFYWIWEFIPQKGLPDRSWMVVTLVQYAYFLFPIAVCMQFLSDDTLRMLYEADGNLTILPLMVVFVIMVWRNLRIYDKSKYQEIKEYYRQASPAERIRHKRHCLLFMAMTVVVILVEVWLFSTAFVLSEA